MYSITLSCPLCCRSPLFRSRDLVLVIFQVGKLRPYSYVPFPSLFGCYFEFVWLVCCYFGSERLKLLYEYVVWVGARNCCRKPVARLVNLAQAGQSRLGEMNRDSPKPFLRKRSPRRPTILFERASISLRRERSRLSEISRWFLDAFLALAWAKGARLSEHVSPERDPSAWARCWARQCCI